MSAAVDTLRLADRLKEAGFETPQAEGMARALGDELMERMVTKSDLDDAVQPIHARLDTMEAKFDGKFEAMDGKFEAIDVKFEAMDAKIDSVHRELSGKFNILLAVMALGFTLLAGLGGYNAVAPRLAGPVEQTSPAPEARHAAISGLGDRARISKLGIALARLLLCLNWSWWILSSGRTHPRLSAAKCGRSHGSRAPRTVPCDRGNPAVAKCPVGLDSGWYTSARRNGTMSATVMDTLRLANRLKEAGLETPQAEGMARALGDELMERMITKSDLADALQPIHAKLDAMEAKFEGKFDAMGARFDAMGGRFEAIDTKFDAMEAKFDTKIDSMHRELSGKLNVLFAVMVLGFTLLAGLGGYTAVAPHLAGPVEQTSPAPEARQSTAAERTSSSFA